MVRTIFSIILVSLFIAGISIFTPQYEAYSQDDVRLGCCKTVEGTPSCIGCGEVGFKCAIDGALCDETDSFTLGEICIQSSIAEEAECHVAESATGCCALSQDICNDDIAFESCGGQHWFDGMACASVPICLSSASSSGFVDWIFLAGAFVVVIILLIKFRSKRHNS